MTGKRISTMNWSKILNAGWKREERKYEYHRRLHNDNKCDTLSSDCEECIRLGKKKNINKIIEVQKR